MFWGKKGNNNKEKNKKYVKYLRKTGGRGN